MPLRAGRLHLGKAITAVNRSILPWQERDLSLRAAVGADSIIHCSSVARAAAPALSAAGLPTVRTAFRVLITAAGVELLIASGKSELATAIGANKRPILIRHSMTSFYSLCRVRSVIEDSREFRRLNSNLFPDGATG